MIFKALDMVEIGAVEITDILVLTSECFFKEEHI